MQHKSEENERFLARVDRYQHHLGILRAEACKRIGISEARLSAIRNKRVKPSVKFWAKLKKAEDEAGLPPIMPNPDPYEPYRPPIDMPQTKSSEVRAALRELSHYRYPKNREASLQYYLHLVSLYHDAIKEEVFQAAKGASQDVGIKFTREDEGLHEPGEEGEAAAEYHGLRLQERDHPNAKDREAAERWRRKYPEPGNYLYSHLADFLRGDLSVDGRHVLRILTRDGDYHFNREPPEVSPEAFRVDDDDDDGISESSRRKPQQRPPSAGA